MAVISTIRTNIRNPIETISRHNPPSVLWDFLNLDSTRQSPSPHCFSLALTINQSSICALATNHV